MVKSYLVYSQYLKQRFGGRVHKISIDAGFSCPNRGDDRTSPGCLFCEPNGSGSFGIARRLTVAQQVEHGKEVMVRKYKAKYFIAYFQPFSNTYAPVDILRGYYDEALAVDDVVGLAIGTRPDCLPTEVIDLLAEYHQRTDLWLEIGAQSCHDKTLHYLCRGHDYACFLDAYAAAKQRGLRVCVHVILGLPGETHEQILTTADEMARLRVDGIKIHLLHVLQNTALGDLYQSGEFEILSRDAYVQLAVDFLERLHPATLIHRLTGDGPRDILLAPRWSLKKWEVLNAIEDELAKRGTVQGSGCLYL
ncbi:MAG: TIGR01212 family radical SAM protein [Thermodesulfobacteriota bacterium]|nr:TIGR01212 family radical SAM protein [Thermodesulfobacteriota bacterium]